MKFFLTGGTGFLGSGVARQLRLDQHEVVALVRTPSSATAAKLSELGCQVVAGDVGDAACLRAAMQGVDGVFHVAGWYKLGARNDQEALQVNVEGTRRVLETMRDLQIPRGVYTSTLAVNSDTHGRLVDETYRFRGRHLTIYDRTKWQAHFEIAQPLIDRGLPLTIVMPGVIYGPGDHSRIRDFFVRYLNRKLFFVPTRTSYCWGYVDDIAAGHIAAMLRGKSGDTYLLAGPPHTLIEALKIAEAITGIPVPRLHIAPGVVQGIAALSRWLDKLAPLPGDLNHEVLRASGGATYLGSDQKACTELSFSARSLKVGLSQTLEYEMRMAPSAQANKPDS